MPLARIYNVKSHENRKKEKALKGDDVTKLFWLCILEKSIKLNVNKIRRHQAERVKFKGSKSSTEFVVHQ